MFVLPIENKEGNMSEPQWHEAVEQCSPAPRVCVDTDVVSLCADLGCIVVCVLVTVCLIVQSQLEPPAAEEQSALQS